MSERQPFRRPTPDELLSHVQEDERQSARGRLKIFLGYAAGVGKTYAMLEAAHQRLAEGVDVVAAYVLTHGRPETDVLLAGLQQLACQQVEYRGHLLAELDLDAVLARRPALALVDELAHTNAPGLRHPKRYQDVEELLAAGIDVYTTLNVQHLESLNDIVAQITGVRVRETIPDRILDEAAELELVDLPPEELRNRLQEGKVYVPEQSAQAIREFFRAGNLNALRELAMRRAAERVDEQMRAYMRVRAIPGPWPAGDHVLVCISPSPNSERLVRAGRRLAGELRAAWTVLYVETPGRGVLGEAEQSRVAHTLHLAEELGGRAVTMAGSSVAEAAVDYATRHNVTKIVVGRSLEPRWRRLLRGSVVDQVVQAAGAIDVYVIGAQTGAARPSELTAWRPHPPWKRYALAILLVAAGSLLGSVVHRFLAPTNLVMIYLLVVVLAAIYLGRGPAVLASLLSVLVFDFFFIPPYLTLAVSQVEYLATFAGLLIVGLLLSGLAARLQGQVEATRSRERETAALYSLSRDLAAAVDLDSVLKAVEANAGETLGSHLVILLPSDQPPGRSDPAGLRDLSSLSSRKLDEKEIAVATWAYEHSRPAGRGTDTLPSAALRYLPLTTARGKVGVLGVWPAEAGARLLSADQRRLAEAFANLTALAVERVQLAKAASQVEILQAADKLQAALLNSISHDLRTPLVTITGALTTLQEKDVAIDEQSRAILVDAAAEEAGRLNRLVGNLLDMTRLEAGAVRVRREMGDVQDLVGSALQAVSARLGDRPVEVDIPPDLPLVPMDPTLTVHALVNLLDNAIKYSPPDSPVRVRARASAGEVTIEVADRGTGIPKEDLERVFEKFYRVQRPDSVTGTGLGLSISKGLVEAHGGRIWAGNLPEGGAAITIALPLTPAGSQEEP